jgi:disulfide bond formation protein DsbB
MAIFVFIAQANSYKKLFYGISLVAAFSLILAYFVEYVLGFAPCPLCLYQRVPFFILLITGVIGIFTESYLKTTAVVLVTLLVSIGLAGYHTGIERGVFEASSHCRGEVDIPDNLSTKEAMKMIYNSPVATCTKPAFKVIGLSMTEWNLLLNLCMLVIVILIITIARDIDIGKSNAK